MKYTFITQTGRQLQRGRGGGVEASRCAHATLMCERSRKEPYVALAGAAVAHKAVSIQYRAFVCFFDTWPTTAPPSVCEGGPAATPASLNTFPCINKPCRCRNALGPALSLLLEFSPLIRRPLGLLRPPPRPPSTHTHS